MPQLHLALRENLAIAYPVNEVREFAKSNKIMTTTLPFDCEERERVGFYVETLLFASSSLLARASRFIVATAAAYILGPSSWGGWMLLGLVVLYSEIISLGIVQGMGRELPFWKGCADARRVRKIRGASVGFVLVSAFLSAVALPLLGWSVTTGDLRLMFLCVPPLLFGRQVHRFLEHFLMSDRQFVKVSCQRFVFALLLPAIALPLTVRYELPGLIIGQGLTLLVVSSLMVWILGNTLTITLDVKETCRLIRVGLPIAIGHLLQNVITTVDRWIIGVHFGKETLGHYWLCATAVEGMSLLPRLFGQQVYPRMTERFGRTARYASLRGLMLRQSIISAAAAIPIALGICWLLPLYIRAFLPEYVPGIPAMRIMLIGLVFYSLSGISTVFLITVGKQVYYMFVQAGVVVVNLGLNLLFVSLGWGMEGVALGSALAYVVFCLTLATIAIVVARGERR